MAMEERRWGALDNLLLLSYIRVQTTELLHAIDVLEIGYHKTCLSCLSFPKTQLRGDMVVQNGPKPLLSKSSGFGCV